MLRWAAIFLLIALIAGAVGLTGVAGVAATIAKGLFLAFITLCVIALALGVSAGRRIHRTLDKAEEKRRSERERLIHR